MFEFCFFFLVALFEQFVCSCVNCFLDLVCRVEIGRAFLDMLSVEDPWVSVVNTNFAGGGSWAPLSPFLSCKKPRNCIVKIIIVAVAAVAAVVVAAVEAGTAAVSNTT